MKFNKGETAVVDPWDVGDAAGETWTNSNEQKRWMYSVTLDAAKTSSVALVPAVLVYSLDTLTTCFLDRYHLVKTQEPEGTLLRAFLHPSEDHVLATLKGPEGQIQCSSNPPRILPQF